MLDLDCGLYYGADWSADPRASERAGTKWKTLDELLTSLKIVSSKLARVLLSVPVGHGFLVWHTFASSLEELPPLQNPWGYHILPKVERTTQASRMPGNQGKPSNCAFVVADFDHEERIARTADQEWTVANDQADHVGCFGGLILLLSETGPKEQVPERIRSFELLGVQGPHRQAGIRKSAKA